MNVKNLVLGLGIVILFTLVLWQGVEAFYPSPNYSDFCPEVRTAEYVDNSVRCAELGGKWNSDLYAKPVDPDSSIREAGYCDLDYYCREEYDSARDSHSQKVFFISIVVAIFAFAVGYFVLSVEPVGSALIGSGFWSVFWGSVINWSNFSNIWRFLLLLIALVFVVWLALRLNNKVSGKKVVKDKKGPVRKKKVKKKRK